jgi:hypothetical protein
LYAKCLAWYKAENKTYDDVCKTGGDADPAKEFCKKWKGGAMTVAASLIALIVALF